MDRKAIGIADPPKLKSPVLIIGFDGWGNALNVSKGTADYLVKHLSATYLGEFNPDLFFRYDAKRPDVIIESGNFQDFRSPEIKLHFVKTGRNENDVMILTGDEPNLGWYRFSDELFNFIHQMRVKTVISIGSMFDNVLHTERLISGFVSKPEIRKILVEKNIRLISYSGPGSIHSIIHKEGKYRNIDCISLWCHCPFYIQGVTHFGIISRLVGLLGIFGKFAIDTNELETEWKKLDEDIDKLIQNNLELQETVADLKKERQKEETDLSRKTDTKRKVINIEDFKGLQ